MTYLRELGKIYWHAGFYCDFFELAASIDNELPTQSQTQTRDPLISFLQEQMGHNKKMLPKFINTATKRAIDNVGEGSNAAEAPVRTNTHSNWEPGPAPSDTRLTGDDFSLPFLSHPQDQSVNTVLGDMQAIDDANLAGIEDKGLFDNGIGDNIFATNDDDLQFEEWLSTYGSFQNIFPSA